MNVAESRSHGLFEGLVVHDCNSSNSNSNNNSKQLSRTPVAGKPSPFSKVAAQVPEAESLTRRHDPSSGTCAQLAGAEEAVTGEAKASGMGAARPIQNRPCCTHVDFGAQQLFPTCDNLWQCEFDFVDTVEASGQGKPACDRVFGYHSHGSACAPQIVYNILLEGDSFDHFFLLEAIANRRLIHIATSSSSSTPSTTADAAFDSLLREQWQSHVSALGKLGVSKGWGGSYWKAWYADMKLSCDAKCDGGAIESGQECFFFRRCCCRCLCGWL